MISVFREKACGLFPGKSLVVSFLKFDWAIGCWGSQQSCMQSFIPSVFSVAPVLALDSAACGRSQVNRELNCDFIPV